MSDTEWLRVAICCHVEKCALSLVAVMDGVKPHMGLGWIWAKDSEDITRGAF